MFLKGKEKMAMFLIEVNKESTSIKTDTKDMNHFIDACRGLIISGAERNNEEVGVALGVLIASFVD